MDGTFERMGTEREICLSIARAVAYFVEDVIIN